MPLAADYPLLEIFWTLALIAVWAVWLFTVLWSLIDNFRRSDHSGWAKAAWTVGIIFAPLLGVIVYLIVRPRDVVEPTGIDEEDYGFTQGPADTATQLKHLAELHERGILNDQEFEAQKQKILSG